MSIPRLNPRMKKKLFLLLAWGAFYALQAQNIQPVWVRNEINNGGAGGSGLPFVLTDSFHNVILCTYSYEPGPLTGFSTSKYDQNGNFLWKRTYQTIASDLITTATTDATGAFYVGAIPGMFSRVSRNTSFLNTRLMAIRFGPTAMPIRLLKAFYLPN